jgi:hypothetical protein
MGLQHSHKLVLNQVARGQCAPFVKQNNIIVVWGENLRMQT